MGMAARGAGGDAVCGTGAWRRCITEGAALGDRGRGQSAGLPLHGQTIEDRDQALELLEDQGDQQPDRPGCAWARDAAPARNGAAMAASKAFPIGVPGVFMFVLCTN